MPLAEDDDVVQALAPLTWMPPSTYGFCHGDRGAVRTSVIPNASTVSRPSTYGFCHGDRGAVRTSVIPNASTVSRKAASTRPGNAAGSAASRTMEAPRGVVA